MTFDPRALLSNLTSEDIAELANILLVRDPLLNINQAAEYLQVTPALLMKWQLNGLGPAYSMLPPESTGTVITRKRSRYRQSVLTAFALCREIPSKGFPGLSKDEQHAFRYAMGLESSPEIPKKSVSIRVAAKHYNVSPVVLRIADNAASGALALSGREAGKERRFDLTAEKAKFRKLNIVDRREGNGRKICALLGISYHTLMKWSDMGRIKVSSVSPYGYRRYSLDGLPTREQAREWLIGDTPERYQGPAIARLEARERREAARLVTRAKA